MTGWHLNTPPRRDERAVHSCLSRQLAPSGRQSLVDFDRFDMWILLKGSHHSLRF